MRFCVHAFSSPTSTNEGFFIENIGDLRKSTRRVHQLILYYMRKYGVRVYPSQALMARVLKINIRTVKRAIQELRLGGIYIVTRTKIDRSRHRTNRYKFTPSFAILNIPCPGYISSYQQPVDKSVYRENVPSLVVVKPKPRVKPMYTGHGFKRHHNPRPRPRRFFWKPPGPFSWAIAKAIKFAGTDDYVPVYLKFRARMGDDLLNACVSDVEAMVRSREYSDNPVRCPSALLTSVLKKRMREVF